MTAKPFIAAIAQDSPVFLNLKQSLAKACELIGRAAAQGAQLIAFPETWLPGYPVWLDLAPNAALWDYAPAKSLFALLYENSLTLDGPEVQALAEKAAEHGVLVVMGAHERVGGTLYNTMLYIGPQGLLGLHRKLIPTYTERLIWGQGDGSTLTVVDTALGRIGGLICWEHWMPLARAAMHARQELVHVAQWPTCKEMSLVASRHYAFEGQCFVIAAGSMLTRDEALSNINGASRELLQDMPGARGDLLLSGGSAIISPNGDLLAGPWQGQTGILLAEIDPACFVEGRLLLDVDGHYSRPDVFRLEVNEAPRAGVVFTTPPGPKAD
jgi:nitrilase